MFKLAAIFDSAANKIFGLENVGEESTVIFYS